MRRMIATGALALSAAAGLVAGAHADDTNSYCGHGITYDTVHRSVVYEKYSGTGIYHKHQYKHDVNNRLDHHPWKSC